MTPSFEQLLEILIDKTQPLPLTRLSELSDLDAGQTEQFQRIWKQFSDERKRSLIKELGKQAILRFELTFESINRLALFDSEAEVRQDAIHNLWECEDPALIPPFLAALTRDPTPQVRAAAAKALGLFIWLGEVGQLAQDLLHQIEEDLIKTSTDDEAEEVRRCCLESLGFSSRSEVSPLIEHASQSGDEAQLQSALIAMGRSINKQWQPQVMSELNNSSPSIRQEAARAAGELELREAIEPLIDLLDDVDMQVRDSVVWALGQIGGEDARDALFQLLDTAEDNAFIEVLEEAIDHLAFVDDTLDFSLIDRDDLEDSTF